MDRRQVLAGAAGLAAGSALAARAQAPGGQAPGGQAAGGGGWRSYDLATRVDLQAAGAPGDLWLPLAASDPGPWQRAGPPRFESSGQARVVRDPRYGAAMLHVRWTDASAPRTVAVTQRIATRDRDAGDRRPLSPAERAFWTAPASSLPTGGIVKATSDRITAGRAEPRARLRAIYDWVVDSTFRDGGVRGCGTGDIENMLETGKLGGKCADINSLTVGLCRAAGIPARDVYGVRLGPSSRVKVLGPATPDVTRAQHCRLEAWLPGEGWLALDPADVRKVVLEARLAVDSPEVKAQRERLFGGWEMNWAAYNSATDVTLPGAGRKPEENFLMYPLAITPAGELDQLDPAAFRYTLTSTAV